MIWTIAVGWCEYGPSQLACFGNQFGEKVHSFLTTMLLVPDCQLGWLQGKGGETKRSLKEKQRQQKFECNKKPCFHIEIWFRNRFWRMFRFMFHVFFRLIQTCSTQVIRSYCWEKSGDTPLESIEKICQRILVLERYFTLIFVSSGKEE